MDFAGGLDVVRDFLARGGFRSAVTGGVALAAYGHPRMTLDLDLVTEASAQDAVVTFMEDLADIGFLLRLPGVDRAEAAGYFERAGLLERWHELSRAL